MIHTGILKVSFTKLKKRGLVIGVVPEPTVS